MRSPSTARAARSPAGPQPALRRGLAAVSLGFVLLLAGCGGGSGTGSGDPGGAADPSASGDAVTGTVTVFAAASLTEAFEAAAKQFESDHPGVDVQFSFGGSSGLAEQILSGAPADVFAAASTTTMQLVVDGGANAAEPTLFAKNRLEIAVPPGNPGDIRGVADFADGDKLLAVCAPEVPCGAASQKLFETAGVDAKPDTLEQDVKAVLNKVELGEVDAGLVYRTDVRAAGDAVDAVEVPEAADIINDYPIVALKDAPNPDGGQAFVAFVLSDTGQRYLDDAGFDLR